MGPNNGESRLSWDEGPAHSKSHDGSEVSREEVAPSRIQLAPPCLTLLDGSETRLLEVNDK